MGWPRSTLLARQKCRPHQGGLLSNWLVGGSTRPSQAMKEAFQNQPRRSKNAPGMGCVNMSQAPQALSLAPRAAQRPELGGSVGQGQRPGAGVSQNLGKLLHLCDL